MALTETNVQVRRAIAARILQRFLWQSAGTCKGTGLHRPMAGSLGVQQEG